MTFHCIAIDLGAVSMKIATCLVEGQFQHDFYETIIDNESQKDVTRYQPVLYVSVVYV